MLSVGANPVLIGALYRLILFSGIAVSVVLMGGLFRQRHIPGAKILFFLMLSVAEALICFLALSASVTPQEGFFWARLRFLGVYSALPLAFFYTLGFTGTPPRRWMMALLLALPIGIQVLLWNGEWATTYFFSDWQLIQQGSLSVEIAHFTAIFTAYRIFAYIPTLFIMIRLGRYAQRSQGLLRRQALWMMGALSVAFLAGMPATFIATTEGLNPAPIGIAIFAITVTWAFQRRSLVMMPVAYETVLRNMRDGVLVLNQEDVVVDMNPAARILFRQATIIGQPIQALLTDESFLQPYRALRLEAGIDLQAKAGDEQHTHEISISPITTPQGDIHGRVIVLHDIEHLQQAEESLKQSEARLRLITTSMTDMVAQSDLMGNFAYISPSVEQLLGYKADYWLSLSPEEHVSSVHPDDQAAIIAAYQKTISTGVSGQLEYRQKDIHGNYLWVEAVFDRTHSPSDGCDSLIVSTRDISGRRKTEEALRESEARLRLITTNMADIVMQSDLTGNIIYMSPSVERLLGYSADHWLNLRTEERVASIHPDDRMNVTLAFQKCISTGESGRVEYRQQARGGHYIWVESNIERAESPSSEGASLVISTRDISGRKQMEEDLRKNAEDSRHFRDRLQDLHRLNLELSEINHWDTLTRRIVERGRELLQIDRLALFTQDPALETFVGSFGTDLQGNTTDERQYRADFWNDQVGKLNALLERGLLYREDVDLYFNDQVVGHGWHAVAYMASDTHPAGLISADNLITGRPLTPDDREIFRLFAALAGSALVRQRTLDTLRENEERYRSTVKAIQEGLIVQDANGIQFCNKAAEQIIGLTVAQMLGRDTSSPKWRTIYEDGSPFPMNLHPARLVMQTGEPQTNVVIGMHRPDDTLVWVLVNSQPLFKDGQTKPYGVVTTFTDITARKQIEDNLRQSEEKYRLIAENTSDGIIIWNATIDRITYASPAYDAMLGLEAGTTVGWTGKRIMEIIHPDDRGAVKEQFKQAIQLHAKSLVLVYRAQHRDGHYLWKEDLFTLNYAPDHSHVDTYVISRDITERKLAETRQLELILEKERTGILTYFIEKASHEFRTPLAIINSAASFMARLDDPERKKLKAEMVEQQVIRITKLVNMLLMMTRLESKSAVEPVPVDVNRMIRDECKNVVKKYGNAIRLEQQIPGILPMLPGDLNDLSDAFQQVLDNAFRYTPSEGTVTVLAGTEADHLWLEVRNTGAGIRPEAIPHIFETFWREDKPHTTPGFGLGLPIAQRVVHMHGGTIHVESVVGQGTTVRMTLPLTSPDKPA